MPTYAYRIGEFEFGNPHIQTAAADGAHPLEHLTRADRRGEGRCPVVTHTTQASRRATPLAPLDEEPGRPRGMDTQPSRYLSGWIRDCRRRLLSQISARGTH